MCACVCMSRWMNATVSRISHCWNSTLALLSKWLTVKEEAVRDKVGAPPTFEGDLEWNDFLIMKSQTKISEESVWHSVFSRLQSHSTQPHLGSGLSPAPQIESPFISYADMGRFRMLSRDSLCVWTKGSSQLCFMLWKRTNEWTWPVDPEGQLDNRLAVKYLVK